MDMDQVIFILWLLLDNAELIARACLFAVAAVSWLAAGGLGLLVIWIYSSR
jgi:hypothetical protein